MPRLGEKSHRTYGETNTKSKIDQRNNYDGAYFMNYHLNSWYLEGCNLKVTKRLMFLGLLEHAFSCNVDSQVTYNMQQLSEELQDETLMKRYYHGNAYDHWVKLEKRKNLYGTFGSLFCDFTTNFNDFTEHSKVNAEINGKKTQIVEGLNYSASRIFRKIITSPLLHLENCNIQLTFCTRGVSKDKKQLMADKYNIPLLSSKESYTTLVRNFIKIETGLTNNEISIKDDHMYGKMYTCYIELRKGIIVL